MKVRKFHLYLSLVTIATGFLVANSIESTKLRTKERQSDQQWQQETQINERILAEKEQNNKLEVELLALQKQVGTVEETMAKQQSAAAGVLKELEAARMLAGVVQVEGPGLVVTLQDNPNAANSGDVTKYIVHEGDIRRVVNELFAAGAEGISINNQRLVSNSAIRCVGPTVIVNGVKSAAPFVITAIGDPITMENALKLPGGVMNLLEGYVQIDLVKKEMVQLPAYVGDTKNIGSSS
ncbi:DUF881 domain-containing protein [Brevibacillus ginsengisoli]|uniref:DUF881 domain-containing protein n=1 Tax=Brevibacillus ginsengisoli TaxID=363854 RepID=UPI003CFA95F9